MHYLELLAKARKNVGWSPRRRAQAGVLASRQKIVSPSKMWYGHGRTSQMWYGHGRTSRTGCYGPETTCYVNCIALVRPPAE